MRTVFGLRYYPDMEKTQKKMIGNQRYESDEVIRYIEWHWKELGYPPSLRDIARAIGIKSSSTIHAIIMKLESEGRIVRDPYRRAIKLTSKSAPGQCKHDWRIKSPKAGTVKITCAKCNRVTETEYEPDAEKPTTWLKYTGVV